MRDFDPVSLLMRRRVYYAKGNSSLIGAGGVQQLLESFEGANISGRKSPSRSAFMRIHM